jgi:hypothetical protein
MFRQTRSDPPQALSIGKLGVVAKTSGMQLNMGVYPYMGVYIPIWGVYPHMVVSGSTHLEVYHLQVA